jgi:hypothetical protein
LRADFHKGIDLDFLAGRASRCIFGPLEILGGRVPVSESGIRPGHKVEVVAGEVAVSGQPGQTLARLIVLTGPGQDNGTKSDQVRIIAGGAL